MGNGHSCSLSLWVMCISMHFHVIGEFWRDLRFLVFLFCHLKFIFFLPLTIVGWVQTSMKSLYILLCYFFFHFSSFSAVSGFMGFVKGRGIIFFFLKAQDWSLQIKYTCTHVKNKYWFSKGATMLWEEILNSNLEV